MITRCFSVAWILGILSVSIIPCTAFGQDWTHVINPHDCRDADPETAVREECEISPYPPGSCPIGSCAPPVPGGPQHSCWSMGEEHTIYGNDREDGFYFNPPSATPGQSGVVTVVTATTICYSVELCDCRMIDGSFQCITHTMDYVLRKWERDGFRPCEVISGLDF